MRSGRRATTPSAPATALANSASRTLDTPTKPATNAVSGGVVHLRRRPHLLDPAVVEHCQAVAHGERLLLVVGDVDERDAHLALDALELELHRLAELEVERAEGLVEQEDARLVDERAARATRWRWPPESCPGRRSPSPRRWTRSMASSMRRARSALATLRIIRA